MTSHPLDNVIWNALSARQAAFAESFGSARRFIRDVGPLAGFAAADEDGYRSLEALAAPGDVIGLFLDAPCPPRHGWEAADSAPLLQMVRDNKTAPDGLHEDVVALGAADSAEMQALAALTRPGPFGPRTHELGAFYGIRKKGALAAMAGERLKVPGYTEVSAVCTHPDHLGAGYASVVMDKVIEGILARGETPFLHVREINARAIGVYERLGFSVRRVTEYASLRRL